MRLAKDWDCMISGTEYGTYRGPVHSVVRAYTMGLTGSHPPWSSYKNQVMQLQLLALPSNSTEGSITFWCSITIHFQLYHECMMSMLRPIMKCLFCWCSDFSCLNQMMPGAMMICSFSTSPQEYAPALALLGVAAQCLHMEFVCFTWSNSCGRNSHTFFLDVCKALDESTLCVSTLILSCVYTWGLVHAVVLVIDFMSIKESLCDSSIYKLPKC